MDPDRLLEVVGDVPQELIAEEENHQDNPDLHVESRVVQVLQDQLQQDGGSDELEDHGEDDQEESDDELDPGEPQDNPCQGWRLRPLALLLPQPLEPRTVPLSVVLMTELEDV